MQPHAHHGCDHRPNTSPFSLALVKGVPAVKSGAEASLDESILKMAPDAEVDSDRSKAMFAADEPSTNAVFWSKLARHPGPREGYPCGKVWRGGLL